MKSMNATFAILILIVGLLSACAGGPAELPASPPTEKVAPVTQAPTEAPAATDTSAPVVESSPTSELVAATEAPTFKASTGARVSFASDILPLLESRCVSCHGGNRTSEGLSLRTYTTVMTGSDNGPVVFPGDAENSLLADLVASQDMPKRGPKLTPPQVQLIVDWINEGALNN